jgi:hypothetical protein
MREVLRLFQQNRPHYKTHIVILNLFQDNAQPLLVILKQVQDDETIWFSAAYCLCSYASRHA